MTYKEVFLLIIRLTFSHAIEIMVLLAIAAGALAGR